MPVDPTKPLRVRCEPEGGGVRVSVAPLLAKGRTFGVAGAVAAAAFLALGLTLALSPRDARDRTDGIELAIAAALFAYAAAFAAFEKSVAILDASGASMRRFPIPVAPPARPRGRAIAIEIPAVSLTSRYGSFYAMYPIVVRFADGRHLSLVDDAGDAETASAIGGRIAGTLGVSLATAGRVRAGVDVRRVDRVLFTVLGSLIAAIVVAFLCVMRFAPRAIGL